MNQPARSPASETRQLGRGSKGWILACAGVLNLVWRVTRDGCLYGVDFAAEKIGGGGNTQASLSSFILKDCCYFPFKQTTFPFLFLNVIPCSHCVIDSKHLTFPKN